MTIQEILEAHVVEVGRNVFTLEEWLRCKCGWIGARVLAEGFDWEPAKRDHVAEVLDEAMRGKQAIAWAHGFHKGRKTENGSHISTWPKNPYREESTNGR